MKKNPHSTPPPRNTHPDKDRFRELIEKETNPEKRRQLKEEEEQHNHPNRDKEQ